MIALLIFILILSLLVFIHELGHYTSARIFGVKVEEFGLGIPPKVFSKKIGETEYSLNALPFGGFVQLLGETSLESSTDPRNFNSKKPYQRIIILAAGVFMNIVLAAVLYYLFFFITGFKSLNIPLITTYKFPFGHVTETKTVVMGFNADSPAEKAGIKVGESIESVDGVAVSSVEQIRSLIANKDNQPVRLVLKDKAKIDTGATREVTAYPKYNEKEKQALLGTSMVSTIVISYDTLLEKILVGPMHAYNMFSYSMSVFSQLFTLSVAQKSVEPVSQGVSGPVGIYSVVDGILKIGGNYALLSLLDLVALISISLAFMNILPFPALDGGRIFFVLIEMVRGKRVNHELEANVHKWGMLILMGFILLVSIRDVFRLF